MISRLRKSPRITARKNQLEQFKRGKLNPQHSMLRRLSLASVLLIFMLSVQNSMGQSNSSTIGAHSTGSRTRPSHYQPPVHISPGSATAQQVGSYPFTPKRGLAIVQPPHRNQAKPGLQDRIEKAIAGRIHLASAQYPVSEPVVQDPLQLPAYGTRDTFGIPMQQRPERSLEFDERPRVRSVLDENLDQKYPDAAFQEFQWEESAQEYRSEGRPSYRPPTRDAKPQASSFSRNGDPGLEFPPSNNWQDDEPETIGARSGSLLDRPCDEYHQQLLGRSILDIAMQLSPPPLARDQTRDDKLSREWRDRYGNLIASGTMVDLQRGYLLLDNGQRIAYARLGEEELLAIAEFWNLPTTCVLAERGSVDRDWISQTYTWTASSLCHKPLYFENRQLERYGHTYGPVMQPVRSVAHFFVSLITIPYQTTIHPPNECVYPLGLYRPGDCAPWLKEPIPISLNGISRQAMFTTGVSAIPR